MKIIDAFWLIIVVLFNLRFTLQMCDVETSFLTGVILLIIIIVILLHRIHRELIFLIPFFFFPFVNQASLTIVYILLLSYMSGFCDIKSIAFKNALCSTFFLVLNFILLYCGYIDETFYDLSYKGQGVISDFGYGNTNTFAVYVYMILISYYLAGFKRNILSAMFFLIISYVVFFITRSRTIFIAEVFFVFLCVLQNKKCGRLIYNKYILYLIPLLVLGFIVFSIFFTKIDPTIDYIFSFRFSRASNILAQMNLYNYFIGYPQLLNEEMIDIAYCFLLFAGGIIAVVYLVYWYILFVRKINIYSYFLPVVLSYILLGMSEATIVNTYVLGGMFMWFIIYKIAFSRLIKSEKNDTSVNNYTCI